MIKAHEVHVSQQRSQAVYAPAVTGPLKRLPIIDGVAPELPLRAEMVGRNAGHESRTMAFIQQKQFGVGSNVTRVRRNEKGEVTDQADAGGAGIFPQAFALAEQQELRESNLLDQFRQVAPRSGQRRRFTADKFRRPIEVVSTAVPGFERSEQSVVVQPMGLVETKLVIFR